jgi:hypothetical protein
VERTLRRDHHCDRAQSPADPNALTGDAQYSSADTDHLGDERDVVTSNTDTAICASRFSTPPTHMMT